MAMLLVAGLGMASEMTAFSGRSRETAERSRGNSIAAETVVLTANQDTEAVLMQAAAGKHGIL